MNDADVRAFLGIAAPESATDNIAGANASALSGPAPGTPNPVFWHAFLAARHAMREDRLLHALGASTGASDTERGGALLSQLRAHRRQRHVLGNDYLAAMERIVTAWCAYDRRDLDLAAGLLARLTDAEPGRSLLRYHPQIRFEWNNLSPLIERARLLYADAAGGAPDVRAQAAQRTHANRSHHRHRAV